MVQDFQTIDSNLLPLDEPYQRLPRILVEAQTKRQLFYTYAGLNSEFVNFSLDDAVQGQRLDVRPYLRFLRDDVAWFYGARADLRATQYKLTGVAPGQDSSPERILSMFSAEAGLRFERRTAGGRLQTLEPRAFYLNVPFSDQDDLPIFDSGEPDFDFAQLYASNRFSGVDRISDANHLASAVTTRLIDPVSGAVQLSAALGQIYRFEPSNVTLPGSAPIDSGGTDFLAQIDYRLSKNWSSAFAAQWSPDSNNFNRTNANLRYRADGQRVAISYRYRRDLLEQADMTLVQPISGRWRLAGRWRYSLAERRSLEALVGAEYETCCWSARASWRRHLASSAGDFSSSIYLQLELKGLGRLGAGFQNLLPTAR